MYNRKSQMESVVRAIFVGVIMFSMIAGIILAEQVRTVTALTEKNVSADFTITVGQQVNVIQSSVIVTITAIVIAVVIVVIMEKANITKRRRH